MGCNASQEPIVVANENGDATVIDEKDNGQQQSSSPPPPPPPDPSLTTESPGPPQSPPQREESPRQPSEQAESVAPMSRAGKTTPSTPSYTSRNSVTTEQEGSVDAGGERIPSRTQSVATKSVSSAASVKSSQKTFSVSPPSDGGAGRKSVQGQPMEGEVVPVESQREDVQMDLMKMEERQELPVEAAGKEETVDLLEMETEIELESVEASGVVLGGQSETAVPPVTDSDGATDLLRSLVNTITETNGNDVTSELPEMGEFGSEEGKEGAVVFGSSFSYGNHVNKSPCLSPNENLEGTVSSPGAFG